MKKQELKDKFAKEITKDLNHQIACGDGTGKIPSHSLNCPYGLYDKDYNETN